jgi:hypothetical protein
MKKRSNSRQGLSSDARAWIDGKPCSFFEFKPHDELVALWNAHNDPAVATWDLGEYSKPVAIER